MEKFAAVSLSVVLVLALVLGAGVGVAFGLYRAWQDPAVVEQMARQEQARADRLAADAAAERSRADAVGAWSRSSQLLAIEAGRRWPAAVGLVLVAVGLLLLSTSAAWARWAWQRSNIQALPGGLVSVADRGRSIIIDPARLVGGLVAVDRAGVHPVAQVGDELAADVARAALVAAAVRHVAGSESRAELAARVSESLSAAFGNLAGAVAAPRRMESIAAGAPALRLVRVRSSAEVQRAELVNDTAELREFVERGAVDGFQRKAWAGYKFKSTGRACSQTRWAILAGALRESDLLDGPRLTVPAAEALRRLGFEEESEAEK